MQDSPFFLQKLKEKFSTQELRNFNSPLQQSILNIEDKIRSNLFTWRGQFSPQLVEELMLSYCPKNANVLDPFVGSGTVLYESACLGLQAFGCEVNPAAFILSKIYQLTNLPSNKCKFLINSLADKINFYFSPNILIFDESNSSKLNLSNFAEKIFKLYAEAEPSEKIILDAFVILLDIANRELSIESLHKTFYKLCQVIRNLPYSSAQITTALCDARCLSIETDSVDFVLTSPPYINVFNYHQNYRHSAELLGWDLLKIAKSEIGSNRANRGNRFLTVTQYCLDMAFVLKEIQRVCKPNARAIFVIGYESNVLGVPFYNSDIISELATKSNLFELSLSQHRIFKNKFGKIIRENVLSLSIKKDRLFTDNLEEIARNIADCVLRSGLKIVTEKNKPALIDAIDKIPNTGHSPLYNRQANSYDCKVS